MSELNILKVAGWITFGIALAGAMLALVLEASTRMIDGLIGVSFGAAFPLMAAKLRESWRAMW